MSAIDWIVFFAFLAYVVWDGARRGAQSENLEGYFAGGRTIPWWAAGLSVMATQASAITVIGTTGQGHETGMEFVQTYFGLPFAMILLCIFMVPLLRKNPILTAYEYLEGQFGPATRTLASVIFLISRCLAFGVVIYAPAVVLSAMTGFNLTFMVILIGLLTTAYTMAGGINAVVWTDVKQMTVIFFGLFLCVGILLWELLPRMGFMDMLRVMGASGKLNALELQPASWDMIPNWKSAAGATSTFWQDTYNVWSGFFGGIFLMLSYFGCDQSQVQRILTNPTADESRKTLLLSAFAKVPMQVLILFLGALLYLYGTVLGSPMLYNPDHVALARSETFAAQIEPIQQRYDRLVEERSRLAIQLAEAEGSPRQSPELLARFQGTVRQVAQAREEARKLLLENASENRDTNYVFPHFILNNLPPVILGLLVAAIFAAAMSSADSALNSLSSATIVDLYKRWLRPDADDAASLRAGRLATLFWGIAATVAAMQFAGAGSVVELVNKVGSYFYGSLLGVFVISMISRKAGPKAGVASLLGGMGTVFLIDQTIQVAFLWYNLFGFLGSLAIGLIAARFDD
ncbi:MAG TPA: sodium:solute symporter [Acidobacteriota bacterium]|nr:sodium:solute symporter [Acidobacteriota bacterium]